MSSLRLQASPEVTGSVPLLRHPKRSNGKGVRFRSNEGVLVTVTPRSPPPVPKPEPTTFDMMRMFQQSRADPREGTLQAFKGHVGKDAKLQFYGNFHKIGKITEINRFEKLEPSPNVAFIAETERSKLFPQPMGIIRRKGKETELDLHQYRMGDDYASALSEGLKSVKSLERLNLKSNRLSQTGSMKVLETVRANVIKEINLSENTLGTAPIRLLISLLQDRRNQIVKLNLECTGISTELAKDMITIVAFNKHLKYLNLAKNRLGDKVGENLNEMLVSNSTLKRLDLHWNGLGSRGGFQLFEGLKHNRYLQMLDVSWNGMGKDIATATCAAEALEKHQYLVHLDMSYNSFTYEECQVLDGGLRQNHVILGLHMDGNECTVDAKGFVVPDRDPKLEPGHMAQRIIATSKSKRRGRSSKAGTCWVCGEWVEVVFEWKGGVSGEVSEEPVYIHLECDGYHHDLLEKVGPGSFQLTRAVPPGELKFFFSHKEETMLEADLPKLRLVDPIEVSFTKWPEFAPHLSVTVLNHMAAQGDTCSIKDPFATKPRTPPLMYVPPGIGMVKVPWSIPMSLFKDYLFDTEVPLTQDLINNCFEFDWNTSRIPSLVKDEAQIAAVKEVLRSCYPRL